MVLIRRAWARAQLLDGQQGRTAVEVARHLVALQAQDLAAVPWSLRARGAPGDFSGMVLTWSLRGTRHLHHPDDVGWIVDLVGPVFARPSKRSRDLGVTDAAVERLCGALPLTRPEAAVLLKPLEGQAIIHTIARAAFQRRLVIVPERPATAFGPRRPERYVPFREGGDRPSDPLAELARRYLLANAPAAPADFAKWSGLPAGDVLSRVDHPPVPDTHRPLPRLRLGAFDSFLLGHVDRSPILAPEHARKVNAGGGMIKPVIVEDGRVVGTWTPRTGAVLPFDP